MTRIALTIVFLSITLIVSAQTKEADELYQLGNYTKAISIYQKDTTLAHNQYMIAKSYQALENYEQAIAHYQQAITIDSTKQIQKLELAKLYYQTKRFDAAINLYQQLVDDDPNNPSFFYLLGLVYEGTGSDENYQKALKSYRSAYEIDKNYLKASLKIATNALMSKDYDTCESLIQEAFEVNPNNIDFINLYAFYLYTISDYKKAIPQFRTLIDRGYTTENIYRRLATCYTKRSEYELAIDMFILQQNVNPRDPEIFYNLGVCYQQLHVYTKAEEYFNMAIVLKSNNFKLEYCALAEIYQSQNLNEKSLKYLLLASDEAEDDFYLHYKIAVTADKTNIADSKKLAYFKQAEKTNKLPIFGKLITKRIAELEEKLNTASN